MKRDGLVLLSKSSHKDMIRCGIEVKGKECLGYLIGELGKKSRVYATIPIQTAYRKFSEVSHGNHAAVKRIRDSEKVWENSGEHIGRFHCHPITDNDDPKWINKLTKEDIEYAEEEMKEMKKYLWLEVIFKVHEKRFERIQEIGEIVKTRGRKLDCRIIDKPYHGYDITFSAYLINRDLKVTPLKVRDEKIAIVRKGHYSGSYRLR